MIIKKVKLVAPPFVGTTIRIRVPSDGDKRFGFYSLNKSSTIPTYTIEWGDGMIETFSALAKGVTHVYAVAGDYTVRVSEGAFGVAVSSAADDAYRLQYAPMVLSYRSNALKYMEANALNSAINLTDVNVSDSPLTLIKTGAFANCSLLTHLGGKLNAVTNIRQGAYSNCSLITGRVDLPKVSILGGTVETSPFAGTHISEFHFGKANEVEIKSTALYKDSPSLGVEGAVCIFDL